MQKIGTNTQAQLQAIRQKYGYDRKSTVSNKHTQFYRSGKKTKDSYQSRRMVTQFNTPAREKSNSINDAQSGKILRNYSRVDRPTIQAQIPYCEQLISKRKENLDLFIKDLEQKTQDKSRRRTVTQHSFQQKIKSDSFYTAKKSYIVDQSHNAQQNQNTANHINDRNISYKCSALSKELESSRRITDQNLTKIIDRKIIHQKSPLSAYTKPVKDIRQMTSFPREQCIPQRCPNIQAENQSQVNCWTSKIQNIQQRIQSVLKPQN